MKKCLVILAIAALVALMLSFKTNDGYHKFYLQSIDDFERSQYSLLGTIKVANLTNQQDVLNIKSSIDSCRLQLKAIDFWLRYFEPTAYKKINGPLPVEWENEVFEKYEKPYKRTGAGLTLAELYLDEKNINSDSLTHLIQSSVDVLQTFLADSITNQLNTPDHFLFANRLFLLNLSAIYTTGFECPDTNNIIPELNYMLKAVSKIYNSYNESFASTPLTQNYLDLYNQAIAFVKDQPAQFSLFDHFSFIKNYINPLFAINQKLINTYGFVSTNFNDYTLNDSCYSIFNKSLFTAQNAKGIFSVVDDSVVLNQIKATGRFIVL